MQQKLWFKRKTYGWGWVPVTWQGWLAILVYVAGLILLMQSIGDDANLVVVGVPLVIWTGLLIYLCYKKGEKPRWQWGSDRE